MFDAEAVKAGRNTTVGHYRTDENNRIPDQTRSNLFLKEIIELRAIQNNIKNKLRKILFAADVSKSRLYNGRP